MASYVSVTQQVEASVNTAVAALIQPNMGELNE